MARKKPTKKQKSLILGAIRKAGTQDALAISIGAERGLVSMWACGKLKVAGRWCYKLERMYDVPKHELRPDIYQEE
jgi:DNA-binding transcriptional regulator YdaS (Cro superfamily)